jgi:hypothetical protein
MRGRKPNILEKATSLICLYSHGLFRKDVGAAQFVRAGLAVVIPYCVLFLDGECIRNGLQRKFGKCRGKDVDERQRTSTAKSVGSKRATSLICARTEQERRGRWWFAG